MTLQQDIYLHAKRRTYTLLKILFFWSVSNILIFSVVLLLTEGFWFYFSAMNIGWCIINSIICIPGLVSYKEQTEESIQKVELLNLSYIYFANVWLNFIYIILASVAIGYGYLGDGGIEYIGIGVAAILQSIFLQVLDSYASIYLYKRLRLLL